MPHLDQDWPIQHQALAAALYDDKPHAYQLIRTMHRDERTAYLQALRNLEYLCVSINTMHPNDAQSRDSSSKPAPRLSQGDRP